MAEEGKEEQDQKTEKTKGKGAWPFHWEEILKTVPVHTQSKPEEKAAAEPTVQAMIGKNLAEGVANISNAATFSQLLRAMQSGGSGSGNGTPYQQQPAQEPPFQIKGTMDIGSMVSGSNEVIKSMIEAKDKAIEEARKAQGESEGRLWKFVVDNFTDRLGEMKEAIHKAQSDKEDPLATYQKIRAIYDEAKTDLAKATGTPRELMTDPRIVIDLKRMEMDGFREDRKFTYLMEQDRRKFELEMEKFKEERQQRWAEVQAKQQQQREMVSEVSKGLDAVARVLESRQGQGQAQGQVYREASTQASAPSAPPVTPQIPVLCDGCGTRFNIPEGSTQVTCPQCKLVQGVIAGVPNFRPSAYDQSPTKPFTSTEQPT